MDEKNMNKINDLPEALPSTTKIFQIDLVGNVTKTKFIGEFQCKIPNIEDQANIAKYEAFLNGEFPIHLNAGVLKIHKQIAYLKFTLTDLPLFWRNTNNGFQLRDPNVIEAIYGEVLKFETEWYEAIWGKDSTDGTTEKT